MGQDRIHKFEERAEELRACAEDMRDPSAKADLLHVAECYDRMADREKTAYAASSSSKLAEYLARSVEGRPLRYQGGLFTSASRIEAYFGSSAAFSESLLSGPSSATAVPNAAVPAATTAAVAALFATLLTRVLAFEEGRTADLARANFVLAFAAIFFIFDLTGARFEDVWDLPRLAALFMSSSLCVSLE